MSAQSSEWSTDLAQLPVLKEDDVQAFCSKSSSTRHVDRGHMFTTESYVVPSSSKIRRHSNGAGQLVYEVKCCCFRSQKETGAPNEVTLMLMQNSSVQQAQCSCTAGKAGFCNHAVAVIKTIALLQSLGYKHPPQELSCTELPQRWGHPRASMAPESVLDVNWRKIAEKKPSELLLCKLYSVSKKAETEERKRNAVLKFAQKLNGLVGGTVTDTLEAAVLCPYTDTRYGRAPVHSAQTIQGLMVAIESARSL